MNEELKTSEKFVELLYSIGLPPMRIFRGLIILLVLGAITTGLYFFNFERIAGEKANQESNSDASTESERKPYEFESTLDQQINDLAVIDAKNRDYVAFYSDLKQQNETIEQLRSQSDIDSKQIGKLNTIQLRNLQTLAIAAEQNGIDADIEMKAFIDFASKLAAESDQELKDLAGFVMVQTAVKLFESSPIESKAKTTIESLEQYRESYIAHKSRSNQLVGMLLKCSAKNPKNDAVSKCIAAIGKVLNSSPEESIKTTGGQLLEYGLFSNLQFATLEERIRYRERNALQDLDDALRVIEANPNVDLNKWQLLMRCYEASLSNGRMQDFNTARNIMKELITKLPGSDERKPDLLRLLERQTIRAERIGKPFNLSGTTIKGRQLQEKSSEYSVLIMLDRSRSAGEIMRRLSTKRAEGGITYRPVIAFKDDFSEADQDKIGSIPNWVVVADDDTSRQYRSAFPIDSFPYLLLIDPEGIVVAGNLSLVQAANRIAALEKRRKSRAGMR